MSFYLKATGVPGGSRVYKTITPVDEVWVTVDLTFDNDVTGSDPVKLWDPTVTTAVQGVLHNDLPEWQEDQNIFASNASPPGQPLGTFQTLEVHYLKNVSSEAWVDGNLLWSGGETTNLQVGEVDIGGGTTWTDNVKIGTSRGASDIFFDGFESGDTSAWDGSYGTVSVVSTITSSLSASLEVNVSFSTGALDPPSYTDLANPPYQLASGFRIDRGRSSEFDKTVTGTATIDFNDTEGVLDPTNSGGPFVGTIDPMRQVNISLRNPISGVFRNLFTGFASEWQYDVDISEAFIKTTLEASDAFDLLAALEMTPGHHGDTAPAESELDIFFDQGPPGIIGGAGPSRIHKALDDAGWPAGKREIFPGNVLLQESRYARLDQLLSVLFDAADAEFPGVANVYISKSGYVTFHGRYTRFDPTNPDYGIQTWNAGDLSVAAGDATFAPISGLNFRRSKSDLINVSVCTPQIPGPNGGEFTSAELSSMIVKDDTSIDSFGWRAEHFENLLTFKGRTDPGTTSFTISAVDEVTLFSEWIVNNYKDPRTRVEQLVFRSRDPDTFSGPATWDLLCGVEIGDILHLETSHPGGGGFDEDFFVEGIHYDGVPNPEFPDITLTLDVSPKSLYDFNPFA